MGYLLLQGGAEFTGRMEHADRRALEVVGGVSAQINIIPTAAAPDHNHERAGTNGVNWFRSLGAGNVRWLPLIDKTSANAPAIAQALRKSDLIFILGGFPSYLADVLRGGLCWEAMLTALQRGACIAGSSAGAMVLCERYYDPWDRVLVDGLGLCNGICVVPHHDTYGGDWVSAVTTLFPEGIIMGIDEQTGVLSETEPGLWRVYGKGAVTLYRGGRQERFTIDQSFGL